MPPEPGVIPDTNFDTLWSMVITLEPTAQKKKEIWFVQDADENRTSTVLEEKRRNTMEAAPAKDSSADGEKKNSAAEGIAKNDSGEEKKTSEEKDNTEEKPAVDGDSTRRL